MTAKNFDDWRGALTRRYAELTPPPADSFAADHTYYTTCTLDNTRAQTDKRTVEAILSSTNPVARWNYDQVLTHTEDSVDLHRLVDGGLPLLWGHDPMQVIGRAENIRVFENKLRARLRFSTSTKGEEVWQDVLDGISTGISIGFNISKSEMNEDEDVQTITRWFPLEASVVAMPADITARIERSIELGLFHERPAEISTMQRQHRLCEVYQTMLDQQPGILESEPYKEAISGVQQRMMAVNSDSDAQSCEDLIRSTGCDYFASQDSGDIFGINPHIHNFTESNPMEEFSLCRALALTFDPDTARVGGPELQIMKDTAKRLGKRPGERHTMPEEALFQRAVTKGGSGANLIETSHMAGAFIPALRERMISGRMGATILPGMTSDIQIPRQTADSTATWLAGDGSDQVSASDPTYDKITLKPTSVGCSSTISRKMLLQGDPASEQLVRDSLALAVAKALDVAVINGSGASNQPLGILGQTGVATTTYTNGLSPSFANIVDLEGELMTDDADMGNLGYVTTGAIAAGLKQTEIVATTGNMVWTATDQGEGRMNGYRALTSNLMPAGYVLFGNWSDVLIALWSGLDFVVDPYTRASYGDVVITVFMDCDVAIRHGESFAEIHEAAP
ncbi:phage major capsid protein [bacterium]|nr:MAG: phage major capsid protein [bacterium]